MSEQEADSSLPTDSTCGFFQTTPREIRDVIYDLISQPKEETINEYDFKTLTKLPNARLICKRFTREYDECPPLNTHLEVTQRYRHDRNCWGCYRLPHPIPKSPAQTRFLHFNLFACADSPWSHHSSMEYRKCLQSLSTGEIERALQESCGHLIHGLISVMPVLEKVSVNISCGNLSCAMALQSTLNLWANIPYLSRVALLSPVVDCDLSIFEWSRLYGDMNKVPPPRSGFFRNRQTMATWTPSRGWEWDVELMEECLEEEKNIVRRMVE
jgi:hypothetical protein